MNTFLVALAILALLITIPPIVLYLKNYKKGYIYYVNFKPESDSVLQNLAKLYSEKTGIDVNIVSPSSGSYGEFLEAEMKKEKPPTLFVEGNQEYLAKWEDYVYNLEGTKVVNELTTKDYMLYNKKGDLASIGYCYETFGIITNLELLKKSGHNINEITNFDTLKKVVEDIHKNATKLGFDAFTSSGLDSSSSWRFSGHLANVPLFYESRDDGNWKETPATIKGTYLNNYKNLWDLYINNSAADPKKLTTGNYNAEEEFGTKKAVFYQNGNWEYNALVNKYNLDPKNLTMIPLYSGVEGEENAGLSSGTENYWAVNKKAPKEAVEATLEFMYWMVTDPEATDMLETTFGFIPFKKAKAPENVFIAKANDLLKEGKYTMTWAFNYVPGHNEWRKELVTALDNYSKDQSEQNWKIVEKAFVDGWKTQYDATIGKQ